VTEAGRAAIQVAKASALLPFAGPPAGALRAAAASSAADVRALTEWRNRFVGSFLHEFEATEERTARWLADTVGPDDTRILFMVEDGGGRTVGSIGLAFIDWAAASGEVDAVVRGVEAPPGLMTQAMAALWRWGRATLGLTQLGVRVRSDNPAVAFYERTGFVARHRRALRREDGEDGVRWVEDPVAETGGGPSLVYMELEEDG
jgi:RimJ/RimL family protein N-acetyltransferase